MRLGKAGVQPAQARGQLAAWRVGEHGQQVEVADVGLEVAAGQRAEQVQAHQGRPGDSHDLLADRTQHGGHGRVGGR
jgi:hypothetical protein